MPLVPRMAIRMNTESYCSAETGPLTQFDRVNGKGRWLTAIRLRTRQHAGHFSRRRFADGRVLEPARYVFVVDALALLDFTSLGHDAFPVSGQVPKSFERGVLPKQ